MIYNIEVDPEQIDDWWIAFTETLQKGRFTGEPAKQVELRQRMTRLFVLRDVLYGWSLDDIFFRCIVGQEIQRHEWGECQSMLLSPNWPKAPYVVKLTNNVYGL